MDLQQVFKRTSEDLAADPGYREHWPFVLSILGVASLTTAEGQKLNKCTDANGPTQLVALSPVLRLTIDQ